MNNYTMCMKSKLFVTITPSSKDKCTCTLLTLTPISEYCSLIIQKTLYVALYIYFVSIFISFVLNVHGIVTKHSYTIRRKKKEKKSP